jgi:hypothetical protein
MFHENKWKQGMVNSLHLWFMHRSSLCLYPEIQVWASFSDIIDRKKIEACYDSKANLGYKYPWKLYCYRSAPFRKVTRHTCYQNPGGLQTRTGQLLQCRTACWYAQRDFLLRTCQKRLLRTLYRRILAAGRGYMAYFIGHVRQTAFYQGQSSHGAGALICYDFGRSYLWVMCRGPQTALRVFACFRKQSPLSCGLPHCTKQIRVPWMDEQTFQSLWFQITVSRLIDDPRLVGCLAKDKYPATVARCPQVIC